MIKTKIIKPAKLKMLYFPYQSLDPDQAIERILDGLKNNPDITEDISKGVEVLRRVRQKYRKKIE